MIEGSVSGFSSPNWDGETAQDGVWGGVFLCGDCSDSLETSFEKNLGLNGLYSF